MKLQAYSVAVALIAETVAVKYTAPRGNTPPLDARDLSARGSNLFARQGYDYCGTSTYYCYGAECCGVTTYNCMPSGAECCASMSTYGFGLYCEAGTSCTVVGGYVQCANEAGDTFTAGSSAADEATTTSEDFTDTATDASEAPTATSESTGSGSGSSKSKSSTKKKSKAWIAGAVAGPLIGIAIIAAVVFFLTVIRKKNKANANAANAAIMANQHNGGAPGGGFQQPMAPAPQTGAASMSQHPDHKTPAYAYTQQYEVPTPISSPPPQWTPASPAPPPVSPVPANAQPMYAQQSTPSPKPFTNELHAQSVSPMSTGNGGYTQPMHQPQPVHGNAMELPTAPASQPARGGAQELHG